MPIVLVDRREPKRLQFGDAAITYYEAAADRVVAEIRRGARRAAGNVDDRDAAGVDAAIRLCAEVVVGWSGVVDAAGTEVPWPAPGQAVGVNGCIEPTSAEIAARSDLLRLLPWNVLERLDAAMATAWRESADAGKGSPTGSGG